MKVYQIQPDRWAFNCPGCECLHYFDTAVGRWTWNGDLERPTVSPSILTHSNARTNDPDGKYGPHPPGRCHLFIREGRIEFCGDSEHALASQTVDLPEWE